MVIYRAVPETGGPLTVKSHSKQWWLKVLYLSFLVARTDGKLDFQKAFFRGEVMFIFQCSFNIGAQNFLEDSITESSAFQNIVRVPYSNCDPIASFHFSLTNCISHDSLKLGRSRIH